MPDPDGGDDPAFTLMMTMPAMMTLFRNIMFLQVDVLNEDVFQETPENRKSTFLNSVQGTQWPFVAKCSECKRHNKSSYSDSVSSTKGRALLELWGQQLRH